MENKEKMILKERLKFGLAFMLFFYLLTMPFALYMDSRTQRDVCEGMDVDLKGAIISTRPLHSPLFTIQYFDNGYQEMNVTTFTEYSAIYLYLERDGDGLFVSDKPGLKNSSDWFIHKTNQYGIVEVCVKLSPNT